MIKKAGKVSNVRPLPKLKLLLIPIIKMGTDRKPVMEQVKRKVDLRKSGKKLTATKPSKSIKIMTASFLRIDILSLKKKRIVEKLERAKETPVIAKKS